MSTEMKTTRSSQSLAICYQDKIIQDDQRRIPVVACGYADDGRFGYFLCMEKNTHDGNPHQDYYEYSDVKEFYPKENNQTYQTVLKAFKDWVTTG